MTTLYEIGERLQAIFDRIDEMGGELDAELDAYLAAAEQDEREKIEAYLALYAEIRARREWREEEIARIRQLADADEATEKRLKDRLLAHFKARGIKKFDGLRFVASVCKNGGKTPIECAAWVKDEPERLPAAYQRIRVEADVDRMRTDLEAGKTLEFATLGERGEHLRIR